MANERIILGIDPGTIMGFGLIRVINKKMEFCNSMNCSYPNTITIIKAETHFERTIELIDTHNPDEVAIEAPFFGKNVQSKLGRARCSYGSGTREIFRLLNTNQEN
jgi:crossover junction endodeoxyribonuclease RuvC